MNAHVKDITTRILLCNPEIYKFLAAIERTDEEGYPEKPTRGTWELNGEMMPCGANFPGGRSDVPFLIQRLREVINPPQKGKRPWSDFLAFNPSSELTEEINGFDLDLNPKIDPMEIWLTLEQSFREVKDALLLVKLFAEVFDETRVARKEIKNLELISNFVKIYYKTNPETRRWKLDYNGRKIVEKRIDTYYYLGTTEAEGLPRVTYRKEIIGSSWFNLSNPSEILYPGCLNFLQKTDTKYILRDYKERQIKKLASNATSMSEKEVDEWERWAKKVFS